MRPELLLAVGLLAACSRGEKSLARAVPSSTAVTPVSPPALPSAAGAVPAPVASSSTDATRAQPEVQQFTVSTKGSAFGLVIAPDALEYCDEGGGHRVSLATGGETPSNRVCAAPDEPNGGCGDVGFDVDVRYQRDQPEDIVDIADDSFPMSGRVHDCSGSNGLLAVATGSDLVLIDPKTRRSDTLARTAVSRVKLGQHWIAWVIDAELHGKRLSLK